jgi:Beta-propeller repeat
LTNGFLSAFDVRSGKLLYSTYLGGSGNDRVTGVSVAPSGEVYVAGTTDSKGWAKIGLVHFGNVGATDGFIVRLDPTGKLRPVGVRIGGSGEESLAGIDLDSQGDIYAVGTTNSPNFPVKGPRLSNLGSAFVAKISGQRFADKQGGVMWSRRIGGHGEDALLSVSAGLPGSIFASGRSSSGDFPTTENAIYRHLEARNDSTLAELRAHDGRIQFATFVGGTRHQNANWYNDEATGVVANARGDIYVTGCTLDSRVPVTPNALQTQPAGNADAFVLRIRFVVHSRSSMWTTTERTSAK